jgi:hypothetical protein
LNKYFVLAIRYFFHVIRSIISSLEYTDKTASGINLTSFDLFQPVTFTNLRQVGGTTHAA